MTPRAATYWERVRALVRDALPGASIEVDPPRDVEGRWFVDFEEDGHRVVVEWGGEGPIGVSSSDDPGYGEGPEESYEDVAQAAQRVIELLRHRRRTERRVHGRG